MKDELGLFLSASRTFASENSVNAFVGQFKTSNRGRKRTIASRESPTDTLHGRKRRHVEILGDKIHGRTNVEERINRVEVVDEVRGPRKSEALIWDDERKDGRVSSSSVVFLNSRSVPMPRSI
jgi:hypothetical protein